MFSAAFSDGVKARFSAMMNVSLHFEVRNLSLCCTECQSSFANIMFKSLSNSTTKILTIKTGIFWEEDDLEN